MSEENQKPTDVDTETPTPDDGVDNSAQTAPGRSSEELAEAKNKYLYLRADFENYKRQMIKERSDLIKFGSEPVLREFLNILDDLERASEIEIKADNIDSYKNGVTLIVNQFKKVFVRFGVEEIPSKGALFDPQIHEALGAHDNPELPPNTILDVFKKAYKLHGKVIRPAQVLVNSTSKGE